MKKDPFSEFFSDLMLKGLQIVGRFYGEYRGKVIDNKDPFKIGRLKISCPPLYGTNNPTVWVLPKGMAAGIGNGIYWVPPIGAPIFISCENGDVRFPLWSYGWFLKDKGIEGADAGVHIFQTPFGHRIELNDNDKFIDIKHPGGFHVKLYQDGIFIGKDDKNLGKFLDDLFTLLEGTTVPTIFGASPFNNVLDYTNLHAELQQFLKTS